MIIDSSQLSQLVSQARRDAPNETWGMIAGKDGRALKIFPMANIHATPQTRYVADPLELLRVVREIEDVNGWEILAIYHSHPKTEAYPSATDIGEAHYPDSIYMIVSLQNPDQAKVRGYRIVEGNVSEISIEIEDEGESPRTNSGHTPRRADRPSPRRAVAALSKRRSSRRNARRPRRRLSK
jgi:[CysO sulfur-carrier protein]-S-L-cysteine hydrolase